MAVFANNKSELSPFVCVWDTFLMIPSFADKRALNGDKKC